MLQIGITGGIGSGKTTVCHIFEHLGIPVYYADERSKYLLNHDEQIRKQIINLFGEMAYLEDGNLNRAAIASIAFNDKDKLKALEAISHPAVKMDFENWLKAQDSPYIVKEAALLFEAGTYKSLDYNILVFAPQNIRIKRVVARDHISREQVKTRISKQMPEKDKRKMANFILPNDERTLVIPQVLFLHGFFIKNMLPESSMKGLNR